MALPPNAIIDVSKLAMLDISSRKHVIAYFVGGGQAVLRHEDAVQLTDAMEELSQRKLLIAQCAPVAPVATKAKRGAK